MPLKWERGTNPYIHNYFGRLLVGPVASAQQIAAKAKQLTQKLQKEQLELKGELLDEHAIKEASTKLREPASLAEELLLAHPHAQAESTELKTLIARLRDALQFPDDRQPLSLIHPAAIFWFTPSPGAEAAALPEWDAFGMVGPNDEEDLSLDIVFDC
jgi:hypothetical protein